MPFHHSKLILASFHHSYVIPKSSHHFNVIPSFWTHSHVIPSHLKLKSYGLWNFLKIHHSKHIPGRNDLRMRYFSFWGHSQMDFFQKNIHFVEARRQFCQIFVCLLLGEASSAELIPYSLSATKWQRLDCHFNHPVHSQPTHLLPSIYLPPCHAHSKNFFELLSAKSNGHFQSEISRRNK